MDEKFNKLKEWFIKNGGYIADSIIRKKTEEGHYGLFTTEKLESDTIIIKTPPNLCLNILDDIKGIDTSDFTKIILSLLIELNKGHESFFYYSFQLLPTLDELKSYSIRLCDEDIINKLKILGFNLRSIKHISAYKEIYEEIFLINNKNKYIEDLDSNNITYAILIKLYYYWENGYDPVIGFINHKKGNLTKIIDTTGGGIMKLNKIIYENSEVFNLYLPNISSEALTFYYNFIDIENLDISLSLQFTAANALDFYKAKLLMDIGLNSKLNEQKLSTYTSIDYIDFDSSIIVNKYDLSKLFKVASILSINKIGDIDNTNVVETYKMSKNILKMNLNSINLDNNDYLEEIKTKYPHVGILIEEKYNLLQNMINHINILLQDYINN